MADDLDLIAETREALLEAIKEASKSPAGSSIALRFAEAYAFVSSPNQSHGSAGH